MNSLGRDMYIPSSMPRSVSYKLGNDKQRPEFQWNVENARPGVTIKYAPITKRRAAAAGRQVVGWTPKRPDEDFARLLGEPVRRMIVRYERLMGGSFDVERAP